ncbi:hypothetical protein [Halodurantibacterium flavum]|uniref:Uncharacterized protein n=1 Tax=Halodurantibacterium flavum TaxID=1382802 RepID=A0ABW4S8B7_9RHOB
MTHSRHPAPDDAARMAQHWEDLNAPAIRRDRTRRIARMALPAAIVAALLLGASVLLAQTPPGLQTCPPRHDSLTRHCREPAAPSVSPRPKPRPSSPFFGLKVGGRYG